MHGTTAPQGSLIDQETAPSSLDTVPTSARSANRRRRRCFHRVISGLERGGQLRFVTLTSSDDSPQDTHPSFRALVMRLRRRGLLQGYIQVKEQTKAGAEHIHVIFRGSYIDQVFLAHLWDEIHHAHMVDIRKVRNLSTKGRMAGYLAKYMAKDDHRRYSWSWGWVWKGFVRDWTALKQSYNIRASNNPESIMQQLISHWAWLCRKGKPPWIHVGTKDWRLSDWLVEQRRRKELAQ